MKLIYTHQNTMIVGLIQGKLETEGIQTTLKNAMGSGGAGELAPTDLWPEIWIINDNDTSRAEAVLANMEQQTPDKQWQCSACGEINEASFELCWHCQNISPQASKNSD